MNTTIKRSNAFTKESRNTAIAMTLNNNAMKAEKKKQKQMKETNYLLCARAYTQKKLNRTAIVELSVCVCAVHLNYCSIEQLVQFIENDLEIVSIAHKSDNYSNARRIRNHITETLVKDKIVTFNSETDVVKFSSTLIEQCRKNKAFKAKINQYLSEVEKRNFNNFE